MTTQHLDGFDYIAPGTGLGAVLPFLNADGWYNINQAYGDDFSFPAGRFGEGTCLQIQPNGGGRAANCYRALDHRYTAGYVLGIAINNNFSNATFFLLFDGVRGGAEDILTLQPTNLGILKATVNGGTTYSSRTGVMRQNTWHYIQVKHTAAIFQVLLDGEVVISVSSPPAPNSFDGYHIGRGEFSAGSMQFDDIYINDPSLTDSNTDFLGNVIVRTQAANGNDTVTWTPHGLANNWQNVIDASFPAGHYNDTANVGDTDLYTVAPGADARTIFALQVKGVFAQDTGVQLYGANCIKLAGGVHAGPQFGSPSLPGLKSFSTYWDLNPETSARFTSTQINSMSYGPKLAASD